MNMNEKIRAEYDDHDKYMFDMTGFTYDDPFVNRNIIKHYSNIACEHRLQAEFIMEVFKILDVKPEQLLRACQGALMEWDM